MLPTQKYFIPKISRMLKQKLDIKGKDEWIKKLKNKKNKGKMRRGKRRGKERVYK